MNGSLRRPKFGLQTMSYLEGRDLTKSFDFCMNGQKTRLMKMNRFLRTKYDTQASVIIGKEFGKYKKFEKLAIRIRNFLNLKSVGEVGKAKKWISAE